MDTISTMSDKTVSIAIETSCQQGGVALGINDEIVEARDLGKSRRHAALLPAAIDSLFRENGLKPADLNEVYVSAGPGSYTGLRVSMAFATSLVHTNPTLKFVSVPTALAIAERISGTEWDKLVVLLAAKDNAAWSVLIERPESIPQIVDGPVICSPDDLISRWSPEILVSGEGAGFMEIPENIEVVEADRRLPLISDVWAVGRRMALAGNFTPADHLGPVYARKPEAVRLWEQKNPS